MRTIKIQIDDQRFEIVETANPNHARNSWEIYRITPEGLRLAHLAHYQLLPAMRYVCDTACRHILDDDDTIKSQGLAMDLAERNKQEDQLHEDVDF